MTQTPASTDYHIVTGSRAITDATGHFSFPFSTISAGVGTLTIGDQSFRVSYAGTPKQLVVRGNGLAEGPAIPGADGPVDVPMPGRVRPKPTGQPTEAPSARPRRP